MSADQTRCQGCIRSTERHWVECLGATPEQAANPAGVGDDVLVRAAGGWVPATVTGLEDARTDDYWVTFDGGVSQVRVGFADVRPVPVAERVRRAARRVLPLAGFAMFLAVGWLADGVLLAALVVLAVVGTAMGLIRGQEHPADLEVGGDDCGWCGDPVEAGTDYCTDFCREAEAREYRAWERTEMVWEVDAPDGHVVYLGDDLNLASELYHSEPAGAHLHLTARLAMSGGQS